MNLSKIRKEYNAGYDSGKESLNHPTDRLYQDNLRKMEIGRNSSEILVKVYWQGYFDAVNNFMRNDIGFGLDSAM